MTTIPQAFDTLRRDLELTEAQRKAAKAQKDRFSEHLKQRLALDAQKQVKLSGSFRRATSIRKLNDIDLLAVLDGTQHGDLVERHPDEAMTLVADAIDAAYPNKSRPRLQDHTVCVEFSGTGITFEVAPALRRPGGVGYFIPEKSSNGWIETHPDAHRGHLKQANEWAGGKLVPLVKMAKLWKRDQDVKITSFHLEMMACEAFNGAPASYPDGLAALFDFCAGRVLDRLPPPGGIGPDIDARLTDADRLRLSKRFGEAAAQAREAIERAASSTAEAHWLWRELIGQRYPERGVKPVAILVAADAPRSRFG